MRADGAFVARKTLELSVAHQEQWSSGLNVPSLSGLSEIRRLAVNGLRGTAPAIEFSRVAKRHTTRAPVQLTKQYLSVCRLRNGLSAVSHPFLSILFRRYTSSVWLECCLDGRRAMLLPSPLGSCGRARCRYSP